MALIPIGEGKLRFAIDDTVLCNCAGGWTDGKIVAHYYRQTNFPTGYCAAYQVRLNDGRMIFAPRDESCIIKPGLALLEVYWDRFFEAALAAGNIAEQHMDKLSDRVATRASEDTRREELETQLEEHASRALLFWVPPETLILIIEAGGVCGCCRMAQTCQYLRAAAKLPDIWTHFIERDPPWGR